MKRRISDRMTENDGAIGPSIIFSVGMIILLLAFFSGDQAIEDRFANREYCEMVYLFHKTNGEFGWPDFDEDIVCDEDATINDSE